VKSAEVTEAYCIFGAGGHATDLVGQVVEAEGRILALVDEFAPGRELLGLPVVDFETAAARHADAAWLMAIGHSPDRARVAQRLDSRGLRISRFVSPRAFVARDAVLAEGAQVFAGCCISSNVRIGRGAILNFNCTVSHDCSIGDFVTVSPACAIAGRVSIGDGAFIGIGAALGSRRLGARLSIGEAATIAAGAVVIDDVPAGGLVAGVPARAVERRMD
jgi:acetyltransferase EpsM